ncbi:acyl-ACP thioesterase domain-containing protein [Rhodococcus sp. 06-1460-1B]|uniref:acyl-ACP thioesterase domain-containing protein n=1 Tax=Rhodococcus sp. 06-1460-1B TaxID=2022501 RepID=UPI000B9B746B|nr:acyl-ACP thioesterase domain-containing protein [Rhodococcus sp. 06-1460-1B]OZD61914.1 acyl-ACP thioesterase [Rhodococcus sp. 06-1460-1B]
MTDVEAVKPTGVHPPSVEYVLPDIPHGAEVFAANYRIRTSDVDPAMRLRLDGVARFVQDISADMIEASAFCESDPFWILRRTIIDVVEPATWPGDVEVQRWCSATSSRWVNMRQRLVGVPEVAPFNTQTRTPGLIETESFCIKIDGSGRLSRISEEALAQMSESVSNNRLRWRAMNTDPVPPASIDDGTFTLRASDIDPFAHMNNTVYWQAIENVLRSRSDLTSVPHRIVVEFVRPVPADVDAVVIRTQTIADRLSIWMLLPDDTVAATAVVTAVDDLRDY